jgi:hypothetical protein
VDDPTSSARTPLLNILPTSIEEWKTQENNKEVVLYKFGHRDKLCAVVCAVLARGFDQDRNKSQLSPHLLLASSQQLPSSFGPTLVFRYNGPQLLLSLAGRNRPKIRCNNVLAYNDRGQDGAVPPASRIPFS